MNKWLRITLVSVLTLVVLAGVGAAGYRLGLTQNPEVIKQLAELRAQRYSQFQDQSGKAIAPQQNQNNGMTNPHAQGFDQRSRFDRRDDRGGRDGSPIFGLFHLMILGALGWFGYKYAKNSGWKIVREAQPAPVKVESAPVTDEKKDEE